MDKDTARTLRELWDALVKLDENIKMLTHVLEGLSEGEIAEGYYPAALEQIKALVKQMDAAMPEAVKITRPKHG